MTTPSLRSYILGKSSGRQHGGATPSTVKAPCWVRYSSSPEGFAPPSAVRSHEAPDGEPWRLMINGCFKKRLIPDFRAQKVVSLPFLKNYRVAQVMKSFLKKSVGGRESSFITIPYLLGRLASKCVSSPQFSKVSGTKNRRYRNPEKAFLRVTFPLT